MHSRSESGLSLDWHEVLAVKWAELSEARRKRQLDRINAAMEQLDRQPTAEEKAAAMALLEREPELLQGDLLIGAKK